MSVYDESGVPVAMHPIQATSKTDQPERINLPNGCYWQETNSRNRTGCIYDSAGKLVMLMVTEMDAQALAEALKSGEKIHG